MTCVISVDVVEQVERSIVGTSSEQARTESAVVNNNGLGVGISSGTDGHGDVHEPHTQRRLSEEHIP